jgi:hypothetical protein
LGLVEGSHKYPVGPVSPNDSPPTPIAERQRPTDAPPLAQLR